MNRQGKFTEVQAYVIDTGIQVTFRLSLPEYGHYQYAQGLITEDEAEAALEGSLNFYTRRRMERLARHLSTTG